MTVDKARQGRWGAKPIRNEIKRQRSAPTIAEQIATGQSAGFTLAEIARMFGRDGRPDIPRADLHAKADTLQRQISDLRVLCDVLRHVANCPAPSHLECPTFRKLMKATSDRQITNRRAGKG